MVSLQVLTTLPEGAMLEWVPTFRKARSLESRWIWPWFNLFERVHAELEKLRSDFAPVRTEMLNERVIRAEHHLGFNVVLFPASQSSHDSVLPAIRNVGSGSP
jgi:hypothetical protein